MASSSDAKAQTLAAHSSGSASSTSGNTTSSANNNTSNNSSSSTQERNAALIASAKATAAANQASNSGNSTSSNSSNSTTSSNPTASDLDKASYTAWASKYPDATSYGNYISYEYGSGAGDGNVATGSGATPTGSIASYKSADADGNVDDIYYDANGNMLGYKNDDGTYTKPDEVVWVYAEDGQRYKYVPDGVDSSNLGSKVSSGSGDSSGYSAYTSAVNGTSSGATTAAATTLSPTARNYTAIATPDYDLPTQQEAYDTQKDLLDQWKTAAEQQAVNSVDYSTQQGIIDYQRTLQDSNDSYASELASIAKDENNAEDNSALYAELRGDKGGIGQAQYNQIAATAMQNRQAVQTAQNELATDTQRAITDLRAQGEFEKADKLLEITQSYLTQLMSVYQWATEYGLSEAEFQESIRQWQNDFNESLYEFDANLQYNYDNLNESIREWTNEFNEGVREYNQDFAESVREYNTTLAENQRQYDTSLAEEQRQYNTTANAEYAGTYKGSPTYSVLSENASTLFTANGDTSGYAKLWAQEGYSDEEIAKMQTALQQYWAAQTTTGSGSGTGTTKLTYNNAVDYLVGLTADGSTLDYQTAKLELKAAGLDPEEVIGDSASSSEWAQINNKILQQKQEIGEATVGKTVLDNILETNTGKRYTTENSTNLSYSDMLSGLTAELERYLKDNNYVEGTTAYSNAINGGAKAILTYLDSLEK